MLIPSTESWQWPWVSRSSCCSQRLKCVFGGSVEIQLEVIEAKNSKGLLLYVPRNKTLWSVRSGHSYTTNWLLAPLGSATGWPSASTRRHSRKPAGREEVCIYCQPPGGRRHSTCPRNRRPREGVCLRENAYRTGWAPLVCCLLFPSLSSSSHIPWFAKRFSSQNFTRQVGDVTLTGEALKFLYKSVSLQACILYKALGKIKLWPVYPITWSRGWRGD